MHSLLHLLEAPHAVQDVELLPAFGEVDLPVNVVWVPEVDEGQVLQNEAPARQKGFGQRRCGGQKQTCDGFKWTHRYGMHGGSTSARAALYALKEEELSINVQYSSNPWGEKGHVSLGHVVVVKEGLK